MLDGTAELMPIPRFGANVATNAEKIVDKTAQLAEINAMITAASNANGVEEFGVGSTRTRRVSLKDLLAERRSLESDISRLQAKLSGRLYIRR